MIKHKIPITILSGFLGAGKTTLLKRILRETPNAQTAVLVNDFADVDVDGALVQNSFEDAEGGEGSLKTATLAGGCVCCSIRGDLVASLQKLMYEMPDLEHLIIEASGVSDPEAIITTLFSPLLRTNFRVRGVITLADAVHLKESSETQRKLTEQQLVFAGTVLLNKCDLVEDAQLDEAEQIVRTFSPGAVVLRCTRAEVPFSLLFDSLEEKELTPAEKASFQIQQLVPLQMSQQAANTEKSSRSEDFSHDFRSIVYKSQDLFSFRLLKQWSQDLPAGLIRSKGWMRMQEAGDDSGTQFRWLRISVVGRLAELEYEEPGFSPPWANPLESALVLIFPRDAASGSPEPDAVFGKQLDACRYSAAGETQGFRRDAEDFLKGAGLL